jgi:hypothetical protein
MNASKVNRETGERHSGLVVQPVSIRVGSDTFTFDVYLPPYIASKLRGEDWVEAGERLKGERDAIVRASVMTGEWFRTHGPEEARQRVKGAMDDLIYQRFKTRQVEAGETAWAVPSLLQGERFAV